MEITLTIRLEEFETEITLTVPERLTHDPAHIGWYCAGIVRELIAGLVETRNETTANA